MTKEVENEAIETSHAKGLNLEKEFAEYMCSHLGWKHTKVRKQMSSKWNMAGTNVDVIAERLNEAESAKFNLLAFIYFVICIAVFVIGLKVTETDFGMSMVMLVLAIAFAILGVLFYITAKERIKEHGWVECKNLKDKATIKQVQIMIAERNAYNESNSKECRIAETYFVSTNGFVETALKYALDHKVRCFVRQENTFKEKKYWDNE